MNQTTSDITPSTARGLPGWQRLLIWTLLYAAACYFGFGLIRHLLPRTVLFTWSTRIEVGPQTEVTIEAHRRSGFNYTSHLPLDSAQLRLTNKGDDRIPIRIGPNVNIAQYTDSQSRTIRGAAPPEEDYITGWLKENGTPESAAPTITAKTAEAFDSAQLDHGLPNDWQLAQTSRISEFAYTGCFALMFLIWIAGCWIAIIPNRSRPKSSLV